MSDGAPFSSSLALLDTAKAARRRTQATTAVVRSNVVLDLGLLTRSNEATADRWRSPRMRVKTC
jgi:anti-sigma factor ChrR (cupin superfamily)